MVLGVLSKSNGVPLTSGSAPVGIRVLSVGVNFFALIQMTWSAALPEPSPARLK